MHSTDFPGTNITLGKPQDMTDEECNSIRAEQGVDENNYPYFCVAFLPNHDDVKAMQEGRPVFIKILGQSFPPISIWTLDENGNGNFE